MGEEEEKTEEDMTETPVEEKEEVEVPKVQVAILNAPWWALVLQGLLVLLLGVFAMMDPELASDIFFMLIGAMVLVQGIFAIIGALAVKAEDPMWVLLLIGGLVAVVLGSIALFWPDVTKVILIWLVGFWALIVGTVMLVYAIKVRKHDVAGKGVQSILGIIGIVFGLIALGWPKDTINTLVWIVGLFAVLFGIMFIIVGLMVRSKQK
jgi:uncharacterized membrane protein HdeD (DUF308 family)